MSVDPKKINVTSKFCRDFFRIMESNMKDPEEQANFERWKENKKRLKTESSKDSFKSNNFTIKV